MKTKTLQTLLKEKGYMVGGEQERKKLSSALNEFLEMNNNALWYFDFSKDIGEYLGKLYDEGKFPSKAIMKKERRWASKGRIQDYFEKNPESNLSEEELKNKFKRGYWKREIEIKSFNLLETSKKLNKSLFNIDNLYEILRKHYCFSREDSLSVNIPKSFVTEENFEGVKQKAFEFNEKICSRRYNYECFKDILENITSKDKNLRSMNSSSVQILPEKYLYGSEEEGDSKDLLSYLYFNISKWVPIAYKNSKKAIEFFEKETGIDVSSPKEYRKLIF